MNPYERMRHNLNPFRDAKGPFQSEKIQWNDGYDKGYAQAEIVCKVGYENLMNNNDKIKAELRKEIDELKRRIAELTARSQNSPSKTD